MNGVCTYKMTDVAHLITRLRIIMHSTTVELQRQDNCWRSVW